MKIMKKMKILCLLLSAVCSGVLSEEWTCAVVNSLEALVSSCLVVPCSFSHPGGHLPGSRMRPIWHRKESWNDIIYHDDPSKILDTFKARTKLVGKMGQNNCTLEITDVKDHDNGPFCFRVEMVRTEDNTPTKEKFSFVEDCVTIRMLSEAEKPKLGPPKTVSEGKPLSLTCSVRHTCMSHPPQLTWSRGNSDEITVIHKDIHSGIWEIESILTFIPVEKDDDTELTCTAEFHGGKRSSSTLALNIKRAVTYNHIIIPVTVAVGVAVVFGLLCILVVKKYKKRISELQNQEGSVWNRISRLSRRIRPDASGPPRPEKRRSIWSRFSRRAGRDVVDFGNSPNKAKTFDGQKVSKPRCPSPDSLRKPNDYKQDLEDNDEYINTANLNIYGNV